MCVCVFENLPQQLPAEEGGRELVHCTLSQCKKILNFFLFVFGGACLCVIYYTEYFRLTYEVPSYSM